MGLFERFLSLAVNGLIKPFTLAAFGVGLLTQPRQWPEMKQRPGSRSHRGA